MSEIELQNKRKLNYTCRYISYKNCFVSFLVVTGATDGIGKAYAKEVMYRTFNCLKNLLTYCGVFVITYQLISEKIKLLLFGGYIQ